MKTRSKIFTAIILFSVIVIVNPSIANVHVYDNDNQFLGILLSADPVDGGGLNFVAEIFIPALNISTNQ